MENNQKTAIREMDETAKRRKDEKLAEAIKIVNEAIRAEQEEYEKIARTEEQDPILQPKYRQQYYMMRLKASKS